MDPECVSPGETGLGSWTARRPGRSYVGSTESQAEQIGMWMLKSLVMSITSNLVAEEPITLNLWPSPWACQGN